jgi:hypothetical protein
VPLGVVEAINGNIKSLLRRGRGYKNLRYLLLKAQRMAATRADFVVFRKAAQNAVPSDSCSETYFGCSRGATSALSHASCMSAPERLILFAQRIAVSTVVDRK